MEKLPRRWFFIRIALAMLAVPLWLIAPRIMSDDFSMPPRWHFPLVIIGFSFFSVIAISVVQSDKTWTYPSWSTNPFDADKPLERVHLSGWSLVIGAAGLFIANFFCQPTDWAWVLPGCIGVGLLAGVYAVADRGPNDGT